MRLAITILALAVGRWWRVGRRSRKGNTDRTTRSQSSSISQAQIRPVYRIKVLHFSDGTTAVQIEYEPPFSVADSAAVRREVRTIWSAFAPYVDAQPVEAAVITATNLRRAGIWPLAWTTTMHHYGVIVRRRGDRNWYMDRDSVPLPSADTGGQPRIIDADGSPLPLTPKRHAP